MVLNVVEVGVVALVASVDLVAVVALCGMEAGNNRTVLEVEVGKQGCGSRSLPDYFWMQKHWKLKVRNRVASGSQ